ncbi:MAG: hypothetical protein MUE47_00140 [Acidobacteria bacterium]|nr:hypothetical protein [Acidobacteriota bacterium]
MGFVLIAAFVGGWAAPAVAQDCLAACIEQYDTDKAACDAALAERLAQLDQDAQACLDNNPTDPLAAGLCLRNVNIARYNARSDWRKCVSFANTAAYNCYRECQTSPSQP